MQIPKSYFHDRLVLLLLSINSFLTVLSTIFILLKMDSSRADSYIVQYRANLGLSAFKAGGSDTFISFILFSVITLVFSVLLSMRVYSFHKQFSIAILSLGLLLLVLSLIVSNALLVLR
jgi:hypothetical protein